MVMPMPAADLTALSHDPSPQVKRCGIRPSAAKRALKLYLLVPDDEDADADTATDTALSGHAHKRCKL